MLHVLIVERRIALLSGNGQCNFSECCVNRLRRFHKCIRKGAQLSECLRIPTDNRKNAEYIRPQNSSIVRFFSEWLVLSQFISDWTDKPSNPRFERWTIFRSDDSRVYAFEAPAH